MPTLNQERLVEALSASRAALDAGRAGRPDAAAGARRIGSRVEFHPSLGSTNDHARELAAQGEPEGTVVVADEQTRGRGRGERSWHSAPGLGLYMSVLLRPSLPSGRAPLIGLMAAVAVCESLARVGSVPIGIKWPNDLMSTGAGARPAKLAGILVEARTTNDGVRDLVIGMGVNVNHDHRDFPLELRRQATSLKILAGRAFDRATVAASILTALDSWYTLWKSEGDRPILRAFRAMAHDLVGRRVRVLGGAMAQGAPASWVGTTSGLSDDGALLVLPDGAARAREVRYGDVTRLEESEEA